MNVLKTLTVLTLSSYLAMSAALHADEVQSGYTYNLIVNEGVVYGAGSNDKGQLAQSQGDNTFHLVGVENVKAAYPSYKTTFYVFQDGTVGLTGWHYGDRMAYSNPHLVDGLSNVKSVAINVYSANVLFLTESGTVFYWDYKSEPTQIAEGIQQIDAGYKSFAAIANNGDLYTWGDDTYSQLGNGATSSSTVPSVILTGVSKVSLGFKQKFGVALKTDGTVWAWGKNSSYYNLGTGDTIDRPTPVQISTELMKDVTSTSAAILALGRNDKVYGYGFHNLISENHNKIAKSERELPELRYTVKKLYASEGSPLYKNMSGEVCGWSSNNYDELGQGDNADIEYHQPVCTGMVINDQTESIDVATADPDNMSCDVNTELELVIETMELELAQAKQGLEQELTQLQQELEANSKKIYLCHKNKNTLHVSVNAIEAHYGHGDTLGQCK